ncbi:MAG: class I SAM-dependent methyltransferase [Phycisphaerales bacterium JB059]
MTTSPSSNRPSGGDAPASEVVRPASPVEVFPPERVPARSMTPELADLIRPRRPHDDLSFDELSERYNFNKTTDRRGVFARLVIKEIERVRARTGGPVRVLDVGCGRGIGRERGYTEAMGAHADEFWGIEPDDQVMPREGLFDHFQHAQMETAELPEGMFDIVYSFMVMEHVADPDAFLRAASRCLKPGGVYLFMTPNAGHYFTITASTLHALKVDELARHLLKRGGEESYHYPVQYKCNSARRLRAQGRRAGFSEVGVAYLEAEGPHGYMKGPLKLAYHVLRAKRRVIRQKSALLTLTGRMVKGA